MKTSGTRHAANIMEPFFAGRFVSWDELLLYLLAGVIGSITAIAAVGFNYLIDQVDMLAYGGRVFEGGFQAYHLFLILIPAAGGLLVGLIGRFYAREATGHGVPEVMYAIVRRDCKIKLHVAVARAVTAALTIGSGGSAGPEGPIIQIGAAIASWTGRFVHVLQHHMPVLIGCGAAAGIAAIFRAPIAGVLFVMEVFLRDTSFKRISPILIASVISSVVMTTLLGEREAIFPLKDLLVYTFHWNELGNYIVLGSLCAVGAVSLTWLLIARVSCSQSVETLRLQRDGIHFDLHAKTSLLRRSSVKDIMQPGVVTVDAAMPLREILLNTADEDVSDFVVLDKKGHYHGLLSGNELRYALLHPETIPLLIGDDLTHYDVPVVSADDTLDKVLDLFSRLDVRSLPVVESSDSRLFVGMVSRAALMRRYMDELQNGD